MTNHTGLYILEARIDQLVHEFAVWVTPTGDAEQLQHEVTETAFDRYGFSALVENVRRRFFEDAWFKRADFQPMAITTPSGERVTQF